MNKKLLIISVVFVMILLTLLFSGCISPTEEFQIRTGDWVRLGGNNLLLFGYFRYTFLLIFKPDLYFAWGYEYHKSCEDYENLNPGYGNIANQFLTEIKSAKPGITYHYRACAYVEKLNLWFQGYDMTFKI